MRAPVRFLKTWWRDEAGTTGFSLMWLALIIITAGLAVDISNAYRVKQQMTATADAAAHAGAVAIALGQDEAQVRAAVMDSIERNMPSARHGNMISDAGIDVQLLTYDPELKAFTSDPDRNTVFVQLHRTRAMGNAVSSILLQMADAFDRDPFDYSSWGITARGLSSFGRTIRCESNNWIYARGTLQFTAQNYFGPRYCIHSQDRVQMSMKNTFGEGAVVSMPDLSKCEKCTNSNNSGIEAAMFETSLVLDDTLSRVQTLSADFLGGGDESKAFFASRSLDTDLGALSLFGYAAGNLAKGSVVTLTKTQFESMARVPSGLTYDVRCGLGTGNLSIRAPKSGEVIDDIALVTDCGLAFANSAMIESAVLISTRPSASDTVTAASGTRIGTAQNACLPNRHTHILALGAMSFPAQVTGSNVTFRIAGDVHLASASNNNLGNYGLSLYSDGNIHLTSQHVFNACTSDEMGLKNVVGNFRLMAASPQYYVSQVPATN